ncbi:conserved hypothetical protein, partial [Trichinella spiralis]|uniref:hypothetical protein n=1 Tax=Trichinella spiralis TaxID=6334 RepID=UPI0001EFDEDC
PPGQSDTLKLPETLSGTSKSLTHSGQQWPVKIFLLWQSASRHILVLATGSNIGLMATRRTWALDGTFKVVPQWYQKLFPIHTFLAGKLVPAVYCLCTDKDLTSILIHKQ